MKRLFFMMFFLLCSVIISLGKSNGNIKWYNPLDGMSPHLCGRAWNNEIGKNFYRLPSRAKNNVSKAVWLLSKNSSGMYIRFHTNSTNIHIKYTVSQEKYKWNQIMISTSGLDLYMTDNKGMTHWCAAPNGVSFGKQISDTISYDFKNIDYKGGNDAVFTMYLPLYNTVETMKIGIDNNKDFQFLNEQDIDPIVVYGTSIVQGASASRPAMCWTNILSRKLNIPVYNFGFAGNGLMDLYIFKLISEIETNLYVIDCMPNMFPLCNDIVKRTLDGVKILREKSNAPILLVENDGYGYSTTNKEIDNECLRTNEELEKAYHEILNNGYKDVYLLTKDEIGMKQDSQVDGWHPSDIGMEIYALAYINKIKGILPSVAERLKEYKME